MKAAQYDRYNDQMHLEYFWMEKSLNMNSYPCRRRGGEKAEVVFLA
jgi:hypothetical protein